MDRDASADRPNGLDPTEIETGKKGNMNEGPGKVLRIVAVILMALTATMNLLGGVGTVCAAFLTEQFESMAPLLDYRLLYQVILISTILIGIAGVWSTIQQLKRKENAYRNAVVILIFGTILAGVQYFASLAIRGKAAPANVKFFLNAFSLVYFLILRLPGIREKVSFNGQGGGDEESMATTLAIVVAGGIVLSTMTWVGPSHTFDSENWVRILQPHLLITGLGMILGGAVRLTRDSVAALIRPYKPTISNKRQPG